MTEHLLAGDPGLVGDDGAVGSENAGVRDTYCDTSVIADTVKTLDSS